MTEEEAKTKWCPFGRRGVHAWDTVVTENDPSENDGSRCLCIASQCMAWRWRYFKMPDEIPDKAGEDLKAGYCGLAGKL